MQRWLKRQPQIFMPDIRSPVFLIQIVMRALVHESARSCNLHHSACQDGSLDFNIKGYCMVLRDVILNLSHGGMGFQH